MAVTTGNANTGIGQDAGVSLTTGGYNAIVGATAGDALTSGGYNTIVGYGAGTLLDEGSKNIAIGAYAMETNTHGPDNIVIGYEAAENAKGDGGETGFTQNIIIGNLAFDGDTTDEAIEGCVIIGHGAMRGAATTAIDGTIAIGYNALNALTSGVGNVAVGKQSLLVCTDGKYNTALGHQALASQMNVGDNNTAVGYQSLYECNPDTNDHGSNTAVGKQSGYDITTGTGNTIVGANGGNSGSNDLTTGDDNTFIGNEANGSAVGASNQTVIGATAVGQADNSVTLGNASVTAVYAAQDSGAVVYCSGVNFPDTQAASADGNTLDDYEEGLHTVTVVGSSSGNYVLNGSNEELSYTKIGRICHINGGVQIDSDNSASGDIRFSLPFTSQDLSNLAGRAYGTAFLINAGSTISQKAIIYIAEGTAYMTVVLISDDGASYPNVTHAEVDGSWFLGFSITYPAA